jgi:hypothetical protein
VPLAVGNTVFCALVVFADPATGAFWGLAAFCITILAMRDEDFSKLVALAARYLRGE